MYNIELHFVHNIAQHYNHKTKPTLEHEPLKQNNHTHVQIKKKVTPRLDIRKLPNSHLHKLHQEQFSVSYAHFLAKISQQTLQA